MYNPSIWSKALQDGRRQYVVSILQQGNEPTHLDALARLLGEIADEPVSERALADRKTFHNSHYRRLLTDDIRAINLDARYKNIFIRSCSAGVKLCSRAELLKTVEEKTAAAKKMLWETNAILRKANVAYQFKITEDETA